MIAIQIALGILLLLSLLSSHKELVRKRDGEFHNLANSVKAALVSVVGLVAAHFGMAVLPVVAAIAVILLLSGTRPSS